MSSLSERWPRSFTVPLAPPDLLVAQAVMATHPPNIWATINLSFEEAVAVEGYAHQLVGNAGYVVLKPERGDFWNAYLIPGAATTEHMLVRTKAAVPVRFGDAFTAADRLQPLVNAGGKPPRGWRWKNLPSATFDTNWYIPPLDSWLKDQAVIRTEGRCEILMRNRRGNWCVADEGSNGIFVRHNQQTIMDPATRAPKLFETVHQAKLYCETHP